MTAAPSAFGRWRAAPIGMADAPEVRELFGTVFGRPMSEAFWNWKYRGQDWRAVGARDADGRLVAHYGGLRRPVIAFGSPIDAVQIVDVMVEPRERGVLTRRGPFYQVTEAFLRDWIGPESLYRIGFGFPSLRHLRLAARLGLYAQVDEVVQFEIDVGSGERGGLLAAEIDWDEAALERRFERLWNTMRRALANEVVAVRDAARWHYRYVDHPDRPYRCFWLRTPLLRRTVAALAVRIDADALQVMDWVADPGESARIVQSACAIAREQGLSRVHGWASRQVANRLAVLDLREVDIEVGVPMSALKPDPMIESIRGRWWLTGGDTDFL